MAGEPPDLEPKPWYDKGLRFSCTQCGNCCRTHGEYAYVYLTEADLRAITEHLRLPRREFLERYCEEHQGWVSLRTDSPACPFLQADQRCAIYAVRPKQCASWPFWAENLKRATWEGPVRACCPGIGSGALHTREEIERAAAETEAWYAR